MKTSQSFQVPIGIKVVDAIGTCPHLEEIDIETEARAFIFKMVDLGSGGNIQNQHFCLSNCIDESG